MAADGGAVSRPRDINVAMGEPLAPGDDRLTASNPST